MEKEVIDVTKVSEKFEKNNCVYIVNNVIDLSGGTFEVTGANCILRFTENGHIKNGKIKLNNTYIEAPLCCIFSSIKSQSVDKNIDVEEMLLANETIKVEWFRLPDAADDTEALQLSIDIASNRGNIIQLLAKTYHVSSTLNIYSGTIIEGTLRGTLDRGRVLGSRIEVNFSNKTDENTPICVFDLFTRNSSTFKTTCNKFRLSNLAIVANDNIAKSCSALRFASEKSYETPRNGLISDLYIYNFHKAIEVKALSYVKFDTIYINDCQNGVVIAKESGGTIEFGWFHRIIINNGSMPAEAVVEGVTLNSGNNLYFDEIDINDCNIGFNFNSKKDLFAVFVNRLNVTRCNTCVQFYMEQAHITRVKISEVTMGYGACDRANNTQATSGLYYGFLFKRIEDYTIGSCSFTDIYDSQTISNSRAIKIDGISLDTCNFERMRICNPMQGVSKVHKLGILNLISSGEIVFNAQNTSGNGQSVTRTETVTLCTNNIFTEAIIPNILPIGNSPYPESVTVSTGVPKLTLTITAPNNQTCKYRYFFPTMI